MKAWMLCYQNFTRNVFQPIFITDVNVPVGCDLKAGLNITKMINIFRCLRLLLIGSA